MPALNKNLVKSWFVSRAKPFENQFAQWIEACWFKGEKIPVADIDGLDTYLGTVVDPFTLVLNADGTYEIPAGYAISKIYIISNGDEVISIGSNADPVLYASEIALTATVIQPITIDIIAQAATTIKFYNILFLTTIKIYLNKI